MGGFRIWTSEMERTTISRRKSKTTEAVANRGVDADAPRGENEDLRKKKKNIEERRLLREKKIRPFLSQTDLVTQPAPKRRGEG